MQKNTHEIPGGSLSKRDLSFMVSFPHQQDPRTKILFSQEPHSLYVVNINQGLRTVSPVDLGFDTPLMSYGIANAPDGRIFHTASSQDGASGWLFEINPETLRAERRLLSGISDPHSLVAVGQDLLVVSSGDDSVYKIPMDRDSRPELVYRTPGSFGTEDTFHLNSIAATRDGRIIVSGFGQRDETHFAYPKWSSAIKGFADDIITGERLFEDIHQPHTVFDSTAHGLIICESRGSRVLDTTGATVMKGNGYTRGLTETDDGVLFVGDSTGKGHPDFNGVGNNFEVGVPVGATTIYMLESGNSEPAGSILLDDVAPELYDIALLKAA